MLWLIQTYCAITCIPGLQIIKAGTTLRIRNALNVSSNSWRQLYIRKQSLRSKSFSIFWICLNKNMITVRTMTFIPPNFNSYISRILKYVRIPVIPTSRTYTMVKNVYSFISIALYSMIHLLGSLCSYIFRISVLLPISWEWSPIVFRMHMEKSEDYLLQFTNLFRKFWPFSRDPERYGNSRNVPSKIAYWEEYYD